MKKEGRQYAYDIERERVAIVAVVEKERRSAASELARVSGIAEATERRRVAVTAELEAASIAANRERPLMKCEEVDKLRLAPKQSRKSGLTLNSEFLIFSFVLCYAFCLSFRIPYTLSRLVL